MLADMILLMILLKSTKMSLIFTEHHQKCSAFSIYDLAVGKMWVYLSAGGHEGGDVAA